MREQDLGRQSNVQDQTGANEKRARSHCFNRVNDLKIGAKLTIGFGILVCLTLLAGIMSYLGSYRATQKINLTDEVRVPTALAAARAQADLLRMQGDVRGYLALGDKEFRRYYAQSKQSFLSNLYELEKLAPHLNPVNVPRMYEIENSYKLWAALPGQLFELRDDQLDREPAYKMLATGGTKLVGTVLIAIGNMIDVQAQREPSSQNMLLMGEMAKFQGTFVSMFSGLRGYVTTRNRIYRQEYEVNLSANMYGWEKLESRRSFLTPSQVAELETIAAKRSEFLETIPAKVFELMESERWREDLYLFRTQALPLTERMQNLLNLMTENQQVMLKTELEEGKDALKSANRIILAGGVLAVCFCVVLAYLSNRNIAGPIRRLTHVAERIRGGDLNVRARVEWGDEIGTLAHTFNNMTDQLKGTLLQVQQEKTRADDLLEIVIPLGVKLSSEKDFNKLLENILSQAKLFCGADAGMLYLRTEDDHLRFVIIQNDSEEIAIGGTTGHAIPFSPIPLTDSIEGELLQRCAATTVALSGCCINIANAREIADFDPCSNYPVLEGRSPYDVVSLLAIPLKNSKDQVLGVLQLMNAQNNDTGEIVPFDQNLQQLMNSFSMLAAAALEAYIREQALKQEIQLLRIEIDQSKRQKQVSEIVETEFFKDLTQKARTMRRRGSPKAEDGSTKPEKSSEG